MKYFFENLYTRLRNVGLIKWIEKCFVKISDKLKIEIIYEIDDNKKSEVFKVFKR